MFIDLSISQAVNMECEQRRRFLLHKLISLCIIHELDDDVMSKIGMLEGVYYPTRKQPCAWVLDGEFCCCCLA